MTVSISSREQGEGLPGKSFKRLLRGHLWTAAFMLLLAVAVPASTFAQGRGRGRDRYSGADKKCGKFVNCHDARDGRWDGRGPRRNSYRNRVDYIGRRYRVRRGYSYDRGRSYDNGQARMKYRARERRAQLRPRYFARRYAVRNNRRWQHRQ